MATLVLSGLAASAPLGGGILGGLASIALTTAAGIAGNVIDQSIFGETRTAQGPRLSELSIQASTEGSPIPRVYGRTRLAGQVIWASNFKEVVNTTKQSANGGKGLGGPSIKTREYTYFVSIAVALCEGEISQIGQIWADGKPLDISNVNYRIYRGTEDQAPDTLIETLEGIGNAPAYRGTAYVVFEDLELTGFGNRIPQLNFEIYRPLNDVSKLVCGVNIIPGSSEFAYDPNIVFSQPVPGFSRAENAFNNSGESDWNKSLDDLGATLPNVKTVALVVSWFGSDLRIDQCELKPRVELSSKQTTEIWTVAGLTRSQAPVVSMVDGKPAFGGTPNDASVIRAIQDLKARGYKVLFYPFIMMDIEAGNTLVDPYNGNTGQPAYPWRGRMTVNPAAGQSGSPDKTSAAATQVDGFFTSNWGYRNFILHYANLVKAAGGVDIFLLGSELKTLTQARSTAGAYPAIAQLKTLAGDVKAVIGNTKISYGADWSEYFGHHPQDGTGDVYFHLDPLWSDNNIDFIGIDNYMPLSDWRDGNSHLDALSSSEIYNLNYLQSNIKGGEGYDWFYASDADRTSQTRTAITDSTGKPWVFRNKDLWNWWANQHFDRPGGVEAGTATSWVPQSKPIYFTEIGCPAIDKGANQPNVFTDLKSSESATPHFSNGVRDDLIQRRFIEAHMRYWDASDPNFVSSNNPISSVYSDHMVLADEIYIWAWDARPFPDFPRRTSVWSDGSNWEVGQWITGRILGVDLKQLVETILGDVGFSAFDTSELFGVVDGFVIDRIMSARDAIIPLMQAFLFDAVETGGFIKFILRGRTAVESLTYEDLVVQSGDVGNPFEIIRAQETELPVSVKLNYLNGDADYAQAAVEARRLIGSSIAVKQETLPLIMRQPRAQGVVDALLQQAWAGREGATFRLPPSRLALDVGDVIELEIGPSKHEFRLDRITDAGDRSVEARRQESAIYSILDGPQRTTAPIELDNPGPSHVKFVDLPLISGNERAHAPHIAAFADPWPGQVAVYRSPTNSAFNLDVIVPSQAIMGVTDTDFFSGPVSRWDQGNEVFVTLSSGALESRSDIEVLDGANIAAIENADGEWEVFQFTKTQLVDTNKYQLSRLLRGQSGTELAMRDPVAAGAGFVLISPSLVQASVTSAERNLPFFWRYGPANRGVDDPTYQFEQRAFQGIGLRPFSPVHIKAQRSVNNDLTITWVRRSRISNDSWDQIDPQLGEETEAYEIDILNGVVVVRTIATNSPSMVYTAVQQIADFGIAPKTPLNIQVQQISTIFGRGAARTETLFV